MLTHAHYIMHVLQPGAATTALCWSVSCLGTDPSSASLVISLRGGRATVACPVGGGLVSLGGVDPTITSGSILCPRDPATICRTLGCTPGACNATGGDCFEGACICRLGFAGSDCSQALLGQQLPSTPPPPSPPPPIPPPLSPPASLLTAPNSPTSSQPWPPPQPPDINRRTIRATFATDYNWLTSDSGRLAQFQVDVVAAVATAVGIPLSLCMVISVLSGSVVVHMTISFPRAIYPPLLVSLSVLTRLKYHAHMFRPLKSTPLSPCLVLPPP